jgi:hypothetical protein
MVVKVIRGGKIVIQDIENDPINGESGKKRHPSRIPILIAPPLKNQVK